MRGGGGSACSGRAGRLKSPPKEPAGLFRSPTKKPDFVGAPGAAPWKPSGLGQRLGSMGPAPKGPSQRKSDIMLTLCRMGASPAAAELPPPWLRRRWTLSLHNPHPSRGGQGRGQLKCIARRQFPQRQAPLPPEGRLPLHAGNLSPRKHFHTLAGLPVGAAIDRAQDDRQFAWPHCTPCYTPRQRRSPPPPPAHPHSRRGLSHYRVRAKQ